MGGKPLKSPMRAVPQNDAKTGPPNDWQPTNTPRRSASATTRLMGVRLQQQCRAPRSGAGPNHGPHNKKELNLDNTQDDQLRLVIKAQLRLQLDKKSLQH